MRVAEVMERDIPTVPASLLVDGLFQRLADEDPIMARRQEWAIVDDADRLVGIVTRGDLVRALEREDSEVATLADLASRQLVVTHTDELLEEATAKMIAHDIGRLPVVDRANPERLVGLLGRAGVMAVWLHATREEQTRESGWLSRLAQRVRA
jgi:CBS domain-containing protein